MLRRRNPPCVLPGRIEVLVLWIRSVRIVTGPGPRCGGWYGVIVMAVVYGCVAALIIIALI